jgi:hypothetical protein
LVAGWAGVCKATYGASFQFLLSLLQVSGRRVAGTLVLLNSGIDNSEGAMWVGARTLRVFGGAPASAIGQTWKWAAGRKPCRHDMTLPYPVTRRLAAYRHGQTGLRLADAAVHQDQLTSVLFSEPVSANIHTYALFTVKIFRALAES